MAVSNIPNDVRRFLIGAIPSVPHLEALLLLRAEPADPWSAQRLARRLYLDETSVASLLEDLVGAGLLRAGCDQGYSFRPQDQARVDVIAAVEAVYARHVVEVAELIHSSADRKAQRFANAFHLRKEP